MKPYKTNDIGQKILEILADNAKFTPEEIAKQLKIKVPEVKKYIKQFEKDKIILSYKTLINWQRVKQNEVKALIEVKVAPARNVGFDAIAEKIYRFPEVAAVYLLSGGYDLLVQIQGQTLKEVAFFVSEKLATLDGVQSTVSHFLLKKYKENNIIFTEIPKGKRLPVTP